MLQGTRGRTAAAVVSALVALGVVVALRAQAAPAPDLPTITSESLVASVLHALSERRPVSGKVDVFVDLGLPSLPDSGLGAELSSAAGVLAQISGTHHLRIWRSVDGLRVSDILPRSERALFVSRTEAWAWDFASFTAYRLPAPPGRGTDGSPATSPMLDPMELARHALDAISPTTSVSVDGSIRVAGRAAYVLAIEPRSATTLVRRIEIDVDAEHRLPLRVAVFARDRVSPPLRAGFDSVSFGPIDPGVYRFNPPPGAKVVDAVHGVGVVPRLAVGGYGSPTGGQTFSSGWDTIVALRVPESTPAAPAGALDLRRFLPLSGPLLSVRLVDRGDHAWLLYGFVSQEKLEAVEPKLP